MTDIINADGEELFAQVATYLPLEDRQRVRDAFEMARREHGNERRKSGELFFTHPLTVAYYLAQYYADAPALIAALLHDVAEDTSVSIKELERQFGVEVGRIVDGLTKFDRVTAKAKLGRDLTPSELQEATHYKLFETMTGDMRVGIVKIFDRLHNMRTISALPLHKQQEKARETLSVYAPLANRLGMWLIKNELQEISLEILDIERYRYVVNLLAKRVEDSQEDFAKIAKILMDTFSDSGVMAGEVVMAQDDVYRIYCAIVDNKNGKLPHELETPPAIVVLLKDIPSCYMALGHVHGLWRPVPGEFDDYIAAPRDNLYRSLHTTVIYNGRPIKIRFRTLNMQIESQTGVLAKWLNSAGMPVWSQQVSERMDVMMDTISERIHYSVQDELVDGVRNVLEDVFTNQIIVYTPQGEMRELPQGATPIDFAYTIHTEVGHSCRAAYVNDNQVPLTHEVQDGDRIKILRHGSDPQRTWLDEDLGYVKTSSAKAALRRWFRRLPEDEAVEQGRRLLRAELHMLGLPHYSHLLVAGWFGFLRSEDLYYALGRAELLPSAVATKVLTDTWTQQPEADSPGQMVEAADGEWFLISNAGDRQLKICKRCNPRPGDSILGFIRKNGQVTVHSISCTLIRQDELHGGRSLKLRWGGEGKGRPVAMRIDVHDRDGLLSEIANLMSDEHINITMLCSRTIKHRATLVLGVNIASPRQVVRILHRIQAMVNVINVECLRLAPEQWADENGARSSFCPFEYLEGDFCGLHGGK